MDKLLPHSSCTEIRDCLNDVYIHLSNDLPDPKRRKSLMSQCMQCIALIEKHLERSPPEDRTDAPSSNTTSEPAQYLGPDQPYLDMTKACFPTSTPQKNTIISNESPETLDSSDDPNSTILSEYVDVTSPDDTIEEEVNVNYANQTHTAQRNVPSHGSSTQYDQLQFDGWSQVNFSSPGSEKTPPFSIDTTLNPDECPFGGLPATHLQMRQCTHIGWLTEPRRYLPKKPKRYFAGVLDGWLIMYSGGEAAIRPSSSYLLERCSWYETQESPDKCKLTLTTYLSKKKKRHFLMHQHDLQRWVSAFADAKPAACGSNLFGARKLPTPPPSPVTKTANSSSAHSTAVSSAASTVSLDVEPIPQEANNTNSNSPPRGKVEEIYEEPVELLASLNKLKAKRAMQPVVVDVQQEYDIPKPKPRPVHSSDLLPLKPSSSQIGDEDNSFQHNKSKVAAKLAVSVNPASNIAIRKKSGSIKDLRGETRNSRRRSSISSWLYRLSRRGRRSVFHTVSKTGERGRIPEVVTIDEESALGTRDQPASSAPWKIGASPTKGGKVNQIISQLEANGHRVAINRTKTSKLWGAVRKQSSRCDEHNYEPVSVVTS